MHMHRQPLDDQLGEERAGESDHADQQADHEHRRRDHAGEAEHRSLITPMTTETMASVAITAAPSSPVAIRSDSRMTPAPVVPPTSDAPAGGGRRITFFAQPVAAVLENAAQRHGRDQRRADHQGGAAAGQQRVEPGAERAGRQRGRQARSARGVVRAGRGRRTTRAVLVNIAEMAMIGTTGSAPTSGTSTSGISAPGAIAGDAAGDGRETAAKARR